MRNGALSMVVGVVAIAALLLGCGGSGETSDQTTSLSKSAFIKKGDQICKEGFEGKDRALTVAAEKNPATPEDPYSKAEIKDLVLEAAVPELRKMTEKLASLGAPEGDEETVDEIVSEFEAGLEETEDEPLEFIEGNPFSDAGKAASAYGLQYCGG